MLALAAVLWTQGVGELLLGAGETGPAPTQHCSRQQPMVGQSHSSNVFQLFSGLMMASEAPAADIQTVYTNTPGKTVPAGRLLLPGGAS